MESLSKSDGFAVGGFGVLPRLVLRSPDRKFGSVESQDDDEGFIDGPQLFGREPADSTSEPLDVDSAQLLD